VAGDQSARADAGLKEIAELRCLLEGLGLWDVSSYLQSGNAVLDRDLGPCVGVLTIPADALVAGAGASPFAGVPAVDEMSLHTTSLLDAAAESDRKPVSDAAFSGVCEAAFDKGTLPTQAGERAGFGGPPVLPVPVICLRLPQGYGRTKLNSAWFERRLGVAATTRSCRMVPALAEMSSSDK